MNRILVVTDGESDLSLLLKESCKATIMPMDTVCVEDEGFDAMCVLVGNGVYPTNLSAPLHAVMDRMRKAGKPVFCEFVGPIGGVRLRGTTEVLRQRMVFNDNYFAVDGLPQGALLDGQCNECIKYLPRTEQQKPILTYQEYVCAHSIAGISDEQHREGIWALWWLDKNTMVSSIRLCNFRKARFAPKDSWEALIAAIISFLAGEKTAPSFASPVCYFKETQVEDVEDTKEAVRKGLNWIVNAEMLKNEGKGGAYEGFTNQINAKTGAHTKNCTIRTDCTCEIGGSFLFDAFLTGNEDSKKYADNLFKFAFDWLQVKDGEHKGMIRWSEDAWETCYQDDVARAVLGMLLSQHFGREIPYFQQIQEGLDYMLKTTGADGIRIPATEISHFSPEYRAWLAKADCAEPCAHFNAYYHAVLLLAYRACKKQAYLECAVKGLSALMRIYPDTRRETSETEEYCRLILPLAVLYGITGEKEHYNWLCKVSEDLQKFRHSSGGYAEWDTGYKAFCSRNHKGECALLANNGDPVADLLYSNNWLPLGFAYAYMVTKEERFYRLWKGTASFILSAQMHSGDRLLDGTWARAFDLERKENNGIPYDIGWGPYCIETGWTVGEILMGLQFMQLVVKEK